MPVHYSDVDNDDTIAIFAQENGGCVLSGDKDYYRYLKADFKVYRDFKVRKNYLILEELPFFYHPKPRTLLEPFPITFERFPIISRLEKD